MAIETYDRNPAAQQLGGTTKLSGSDPVAGAISNLGGQIQNVGNVMAKFQQVKDKAAVYDTETLTNNKIVALEEEYTAKRRSEDPNVRAEVSGMYIGDYVNNGLDGWIPEVEENWEASPKALESFKTTFERTMSQNNARYSTIKLNEQGQELKIKLKSSIDENMRQRAIYLSDGNIDVAESYQLKAQEIAADADEIFGEGASNAWLNAGLYDSYDYILSDSVTKDAVNDTKTMIKEDDNLDARQTASLLKKAENRKTSIDRAQVVAERRLLADQTQRANDAVTAIKNNEAVDITNLDELVQAGFYNEQGATRIKRANWMINSGKPSSTQNARQGVVSTRIANNEITSYNELEKEIGRVTPEQYKTLESQLTDRILTRVEITPKIENAIQDVGGTDATISTLADAVEKVSNLDIPIESKEALNITLENAFKTSQNPELSAEYRKNISELLELERYIGFDTGYIAQRLSVYENMTPEELASRKEQIKSAYNDKLEEKIKSDLAERTFTPTIPEFTTEAEVESAGLPAGTRVIINGRMAVIR